jgi:polysaccharide pyruvyl transferase WcaK-like protein
VHRAHFVVGMRLHLLIFAAIAGVPFLPLPYSGKVLDLAEAVGAPSSPGMAEAQAGPLLAIPDRLWGERDRHVPLVRERAWELQEHAETTWQRCATVLGGLEHPRAPVGTTSRYRRSRRNQNRRPGVRALSSRWR